MIDLMDGFGSFSQRLVGSVAKRGQMKMCSQLTLFQELLPFKVWIGKDFHSTVTEQLECSYHQAWTANMSTALLT